MNKRFGNGLTFFWTYLKFSFNLPLIREGVVKGDGEELDHEVCGEQYLSTSNGLQAGFA